MINQILSGMYGPSMANTAAMTGASTSAMAPWYMPQMAGGAAGLLQLASVPGFLNNLFSYRDPNQGWLGGGMSGAMQGLGAGSMFGPIGAGIGAGTGYIAGKK